MKLVGYLIFAFWLSISVYAYPEFQKFSQMNSGRTVNCAMCHTHPDGPNGAAFGQIGSLNAEQIERLNQARAAFDPGRDVNSPILNAFGNHIIKTLGKTKFLEYRSRPKELATALGTSSDLDEDGVPDAREYLEGTHPLNKANGNPWLLFVHNFKRNKVHVVLIFLATVVTIYGLVNLLRGAHAAHELSQLKK
ncbi:MAG: hypothetical protein RMM17_13955 [Acidobacteriota bacterium]|nr:hypothetical protein [Blastocatellia bacterium]MDW8413772.1 hypothetical protein [Acidobacteriota bacterium]